MAYKIKAKFDGVCAFTGKKIKKGWDAWYHPDNKVISLQEFPPSRSFTKEEIIQMNTSFWPKPETVAKELTKYLNQNTNTDLP